MRRHAFENQNETAQEANDIVYVDYDNDLDMGSRNRKGKK